MYCTYIYLYTRVYCTCDPLTERERDPYTFNATRVCDCKTHHAKRMLLLRTIKEFSRTHKTGDVSFVYCLPRTHNKTQKPHAEREDACEQCAVCCVLYPTLVRYVFYVVRGSNIQANAQTPQTKATLATAVYSHTHSIQFRIYPGPVACCCALSYNYWL